MNIKRIFVDGNIIIDIFDKNRPNFQKSTEIINNCIDRYIESYTSSDLITTIYYVLSKKDRKKALKIIKFVSQLFILIPFSNEELNQAINLMTKYKKFKDLEDTLQYVIAKEMECNLILTNDRDFYSPDIEIKSSINFNSWT